MKAPFYALAPMADTSTYPFALQCVDFGADLVWTPMIHTDLALNNWEEARRVIDFKEIKNFIIQIVGSEPEKFTETIKIIEKNGIKPIGYDINAGCPDKNIVKSGCGGSLIKDTEKIVEIIKAVQSATNLPVSVKTRAGYESPEEIFKVAPKLIETGIWLLTVHPRTVKQAYTGSADWEVIRKLKSRLKDSNVLICGSGDVRSWEKAFELQKETDCDGVMIGRGALGKPWIFKEIKEQEDFKYDINLLKELALDLAKKSDAIWGDKGITEAKKHFAAYFRGLVGTKEIRINLMETRTLEEVRKVLA